MSEALRETRCSPECQPDLSLRAHKVRVFRIIRQRGFSTFSRSSATIKGSCEGLGEDLREVASVSNGAAVTRAQAWLSARTRESRGDYPETSWVAHCWCSASDDGHACGAALDAWNV